MADGTRIGSPLLDVAQANKETTHNQAVQNLEDYVAPNRRVIGRPFDWMSTFTLTSGTLFETAGSNPVPRAVELYFHRIRIPSPSSIVAVIAKIQANPSAMAGQMKFALYDSHATYGTPNSPYTTEATEDSFTNLAYRTGMFRAPFDATIHADEIATFLGGSEFAWLATMSELWYTGDAETGPSFYRSGAIFHEAVGDGSNIFYNDLKYTPALSPNNITANFPSSIGATLSNFANDSTEGSIQFGFECARPAYP